MNFINQLKALAVTATLLIAQPIQAETFYFHNDHLGTPQVLTDSAGTTVWQANYNPFGEATETTDTVEQNIRFPGQYFEEETGLHYNYFRDYDPGTGRYIESDPIGLDGGINTFGYVGGSPTRYRDTDGKAAAAAALCFVPTVGWVACAGVAAAAAGAGVVYVAVESTNAFWAWYHSDDLPAESANDSDYGSCEVNDDPCEDWLNDLLEIVLSVKLGGNIDDLTKKELNKQIKKFKHACPLLAGEIGYLP